ncbi:hypothetical protein EDM57_22070, partial [Brevibacillus gelatini]
MVPEFQGFRLLPYILFRKWAMGSETPPKKQVCYLAIRKFFSYRREASRLFFKQTPSRRLGKAGVGTRGQHRPQHFSLFKQRACCAFPTRSFSGCFGGMLALGQITAKRGCPISPQNKKWAENRKVPVHFFSSFVSLLMKAVRRML